MAFGFNQISNPTPSSINWVFRIVLYAAAVLNIVCSIVTEIPEPVKVIIGKYSVEAVALVHAFSKMFGVPLPDNAEVKASDVSSLKVDAAQLTK